MILNLAKRKRGGIGELTYPFQLAIISHFGLHWEYQISDWMLTSSGGGKMGEKFRLTEVIRASSESSYSKNYLHSWRIFINVFDETEAERYQF